MDCSDRGGRGLSWLMLRSDQGVVVAVVDVVVVHDVAPTQVNAQSATAVFASRMPILRSLAPLLTSMQAFTL